MNCIGKVLGNRYEILEEIGSGGMATVYKARCKLLNRYVAVKVLRDEFANDAEFIKRFQVEAQSAASLSHPNIVSIYDVGNEDGLHYIVMELIEGKTLKEIIKEKGKLPWREAVGIASQIASGLSQAHQNHIVHRDIKPHNIIITKDGVAKVTDFGIAKAVSNSTINAFGSTIGSVHYFSPEHARGGYTDEKSDIYSLGVVLYEMCTGKLPFDGETPVAVALKHLQENPKEPIELCKELPQAVNDIIMKAMKKDPSERYESAAEMYKDLQSVLSNPDLEVAKDEKSKFDCPTQRISIADVENAANATIQKSTLEKINKYKSEQEDDNMSKKKKVTKSMAVVRLIFILAFVVLLFIGCMKFGQFVSWKILGEGSKDVAVPNIVGASLEEANRVLTEKGLSIGEKTDVINNEYPKGYVVWQQYAENYRLKQGATVDVRVSLGQKTVLVPDVTSFTTTNAAKAKIEARGLVYEEASEYSNTFEKGKIVRQDPLVNTEVPEGSTVKVYVSLGASGDGLVKIPNVLERTESEARQILSDANLIPVVTYVSTATKEDGIVLSQTPEQDIYESALTEVVIVINRLNGTSETPTPDDGKTTPTPTTTPKKEDDTKKINISIDLSSKGERDSFVVKVVLEGQAVGGKKYEYEKRHKRSDGTIKVPVTYSKGAMVKVYIDDVLDSEQIL